MSSTEDGKDYLWERTRFAAKWVNAKQNVVIFFELPSRKESDLVDARMLNKFLEYTADPFWIHALVAQEVVNLQEKSVWGVRDKIRRIETVCQNVPRQALPD